MYAQNLIFTMVLAEKEILDIGGKVIWKFGHDLLK